MIPRSYQLVTETGKKGREREVCHRDIVRLQKKKGRDVDGLMGLKEVKVWCDTDKKWRNACDCKSVVVVWFDW